MSTSLRKQLTTSRVSAPESSEGKGAAAARRSICPRCARPQGACICAWVAPLESAVELLILQHPMETSHAKGSARLLHLSAPGSVMASGEAFPPDELERLLHCRDRTPLLLYPTLPGERALGVPAPPPLAPALLADPGKLRLVVLDGTWRKSRKMLYLNPGLHLLPRLPLRELPASQYLIRKAHAPDQLSTLEAVCHALVQLEGERAAVGPLLDSFDRFVAQFQSTGGRIGATRHD